MPRASLAAGHHAQLLVIASLAGLPEPLLDAAQHGEGDPACMKGSHEDSIWPASWACILKALDRNGNACCVDLARRSGIAVSLGSAAAPAPSKLRVSM